MKRALIVAAVIGLLGMLAPVAHAAPLTLNSPGVVGTLQGVTGGGVAPAVEILWAQHLLDMAANQTDPDYTPSTGYDTSNTEYSGTLFGGVKTQGGAFVVPAGYEYVFAKYDGQNAGYVLFHLPTWGSLTIPQFPYSIWGADGQYAVSHFTVYNPVQVPDGGSLAMLLGMAFLSLAGARRMMK